MLSQEKKEAKIGFSKAKVAGWIDLQKQEGKGLMVKKKVSVNKRKLPGFIVIDFILLLA